MSDKVYDFTQWAVKILLPALATLYATLSGFWDFPKVVEVVGTISALALFLGVILGVQKARYQANEDNYDGTLHVDERDPASDKLWLQLGQEELDEAKYKNELKFRVQRSR